MTIMSFMVPEIWSVMGNFFIILDNFLPFTLLPWNYPENQNFQKFKKRPGDSIILQMCNINDNHTMYSLWDMEHNRNLVLRTSGESLMVFSTMVNLYFLYSMAWRCCLLYLIKQNCLLKTFLITPILITWAPLADFLSKTNLKLHDIKVTPKLIKKFITNLGSSRCLVLIVFQWLFYRTVPELSYIQLIFSVSERILFSKLLEGLVGGSSI